MTFHYTSTGVQGLDLLVSFIGYEQDSKKYVFIYIILKIPILVGIPYGAFVI